MNGLPFSQGEESGLLERVWYSACGDSKVPWVALGQSCLQGVDHALKTENLKPSETGKQETSHQASELLEDKHQ